MTSGILGLGGAAALTTASCGAVSGIEFRAVDADALGWTAHGYVGLQTWRIYATSNVPENLIVVGDLFVGGQVMRLDGCVFHNGGLGTNGFLPPTDLTSMGDEPIYWEGQWDTYVTIGATDDSASISTSPGLDSMLCEMDGQVVIDNGGWSRFPPGAPFVFNPQHGWYECLFAQITVPDQDRGVCLYIANAVFVTNSHIGQPLSNGAIGCNGLACPADVDDDFNVGFSDLVEVLLRWGPCDCCGADMNADQEVGMYELTRVLTSWGACICVPMDQS